MAAARVQDYGKLISLPVQRRLLSLLQGQHGGVGAGSSHEFLDMAEYKVGDDIGDIDWKSTARMGQPIIKRFEQTAVLNVMVAVDTGANMSAIAPGSALDADPSQERKSDIAGELVSALAWLTAYRGDHLGLVAGNSKDIVAMPARSGVAHAQTLLRVATGSKPTGAGPDMEAVLRRVGAVRRGRSLITVITDPAQMDLVSKQQLRRLTTKHEVAVFLTEDADLGRDLQKNPVEDVGLGLLPDFAVSGGEIDYQFKASRAMMRHRVAEKLRGFGINWAAVTSLEMVPAALISVFGGGRGSRTA